MKLFYCSQCNRHYGTAIAKVSFIDTVRIHPEGTFYLEGDFEFDEVMADNFTCPGYEEHEIIVVDVEQCPHDWHSSGYGYRRCDLCGRKDMGKVVFDDEPTS